MSPCPSALCVRAWHRVHIRVYGIQPSAYRCRPPRVLTWRRSRSEACTRTSTHGKPMTTRRAHTPCCLLTNSPTQAEDYHVCILLATYLLTLDLLPKVLTHLLLTTMRTWPYPAYFTLTHKLKRTFTHGYLLTTHLPPGAYVPLATARWLSHPRVRRRRHRAGKLLTPYYLTADCSLMTHSPTYHLLYDAVTAHSLLRVTCHIPPYSCSASTSRGRVLYYFTIQLLTYHVPPHSCGGSM